MAEEYMISPALEGGGVSLPNIITSGVDAAVEEPSFSASYPGSSESPTHNTQHSHISSDISSPPLANHLDQQVFPSTGQYFFTSPDVQGMEEEDSESFLEVQTSMLGMSAPSQHSGSLMGDINEDNPSADSGIMYSNEEIYAPDAWLMDMPHVEDAGQGDGSTSESNEAEQGDSPPMSNSILIDAANMLAIRQQFFFTMQQNHDMNKFLQLWRLLRLQRTTEYPVISDEGGSLDRRHRHGRVSLKSMEKASCDIQGIDWSQFQTTKASAREMRRMTCKNFINMPHINNDPSPDVYATRRFKACFMSDICPPLPPTDGFFRFRETNLKQIPGSYHYQLRHCVSAGSKNAVFFIDTTSPSTPNLFFTSFFHHNAPKVRCLNPETGSTQEVINLQQRRGREFFRHLEIACVHAGDGLLIVGALKEGHYAMKSLSTTCNATYEQGILSDSGFNAGINHVHTFQHRHSGVPHAVFCDNDSYIRVVDCSTTQQVQAQKWTSFVNCSATSPDGRLRLHVSDDQWPIVAEAETGRAIARLTGHTDHGFACDWSPDGMTMATGHQDGKVQVWDARKMNRAVHSIPAEMGGIRSLHFSPLGSGHPVLVMAEPSDFVSIVDARTFKSKQNIEFIGEVVGASMPPDGSAIFVGNSDPSCGGMIEFERTGYTGQFKHRKLQCSSLQHRKSQRRHAVYNTSPDDSDDDDLVEEYAPEIKLERKWKLDDQDANIWQTRGHDWVVDADMNHDRRAMASRKQRWHRHLGLEKMVF